ncbi:MAG: hypothetical protein ACK4MQ_00945 [Hyphomonas sp.]
MSPRARLIDNGPMVFEGALACGLTNADAIHRDRPANDHGSEGRMNLLVIRRRRQNRREARN